MLIIKNVVELTEKCADFFKQNYIITNNPDLDDSKSNNHNIVSEFAYDISVSINFSYVWSQL